MLIEHEGKRPAIDESAYVAPNAVISGNVTIGPGCRVLFGAVLTADGGRVALGERCIVMENAVLRGRRDHPLVLGDHVLVGPHAHLNGARVEREVFLATGVSVFPGAAIGTRSEVRIGAVVHVNSRLAEGTTVPIGWIAVGDPAELFPPDAHDRLWPIQRDMDFPGTVFGLERAEASMERVSALYSESFGRHRDDRIVGDADVADERIEQARAVLSGFEPDPGWDALDEGFPPELASLYRELIDAFRRSDVEWILAHTDPDVQIAPPQEIADARSYAGRSGMLENLLDWPRQWRHLTVVPHRVFAVGDDQVVIAAMHRWPRSSG